MSKLDTDCTKQINTIIKYFDWLRVHNAMLALNWEWVSVVEDSSTPTIGELVSHAIYYLKKAWDEEQSISCGGFTSEYKDGSLSLQFCISDINYADFRE